MSIRLQTLALQITREPCFGNVSVPGCSGAWLRRDLDRLDFRTMRESASNRRWGFSAQRWGFSCGKDPHLACNNPYLGNNWKTRLLYIFLVESLETSVLRTFRFRCGSDPHLVMLLRFLQFTRVFRKSSLCCEKNLTLVGLGPNVTCDCKELDEQFRTLLLEDVADLNDAWHPRSWPAAAHDGSQRFENVPWCSLSSRTMTNTRYLSPQYGR